jgi:DHA1 family multidrug resistance protein-like MFS transporter
MSTFAKKGFMVYPMNWRIFSILILALFASMLGQGIVVPLLPSYLHGLGASGLLIGFIFGTFSISRTLFLPLFGRMSDMRGRKPFITTGLLLYFIASIAFMLSSSVMAILLIRFFQGVASAMIMPVGQAYAGDITPEGKEGKVMGVVNASVYGGLSAGPMIGGLLMDAFGIWASFFAMGMVCFLGFILCLVGLPPTHKERAEANTGRQVPVRFKTLLKNRILAGLFLFRFAYMLCVGAVWAFLPLLADVRFHMSSFAIGLLVMLSVFISAVIMVPMGMLADRMSRRLLMFVGGLFTSLAMVCFSFIHAAAGLYAVSVIIGLGGGISMPALMGTAVDIGPNTKSMGSVMSFITISHSLGMIAGPVIAGVMMDMANLSAALSGGAAVMLLATVSGFFLTSRTGTLKKT